MQEFDAVVVGGGPAGSSCARALVDSGLRVAILDRATFPRVKLCAGWLSAPIWDVLECAPSEYPGGLWRWDRCHVQYDGEMHTVRGTGYFIRRFEFDDWLLRKSGAEVFTHAVKKITRVDERWVVDGEFSARYLIGAGGTHCPVARGLFPAKQRKPVGAQELEFEADAEQIADTRIGNDGEPELLLHNDLRGYSWNIPKDGWLNVGCGTMNPRDVRAAWSRAREFFQDEDHLPASAVAALEKVKGHSYYMFDPANLRDCSNKSGDAFLVGDALGLAQPLTAEGILPSIVSATLCARAIIDGAPTSYRAALTEHPVIVDYRLLYQLREFGASLRGRGPSASSKLPALIAALPAPFVGAALGRAKRSAVAAGFAWLFSGKPLPAQPLLRRIARL